jgi:hypothetical protein
MSTESENGKETTSPPSQSKPESPPPEGPQNVIIREHKENAETRKK